MNYSCEACVGFVSAHCDTLELFEFTEEILDEMTPFIELFIDTQKSCASGVLGNDDLGAAFIQFGDDSVAVESLVGDQPTKGEAIDEGRHADRIEAGAG